MSSLYILGSDLVAGIVHGIGHVGGCGDANVVVLDECEAMF